MDYCTEADVRAIPVLQRFDTGEFGFQPEEIESRITKATTYIDSYLLGKVPGIPYTTSVPKEIKELCISLTVCLLLQETKQLQLTTEQGLFAIELYCKDAWQRVKDFSSGTAVVTDPYGTGILTGEDEDDSYGQRSYFYVGNEDILTDEL